MDDFDRIIEEYGDIDVTAEIEYDGPEGSFASGNDEWDRETVAKIRAEMEWNEWAWCCARVRLTLEHPFNQTFDAYLGGCNYESKEQFMEAGGYYEDMVDEVRAEARTWLKELAAKIGPLVVKESE